MGDETKETHETRSKVSRRAFLKSAAAGVAVAGVAAAAPGIMLGASAPAASAGDVGEALGTDPLVAYVRDVRGDEVVLMAGTREVRVRNQGLVSGLVRAFVGA